MMKTILFIALLTGFGARAEVDLCSPPSSSLSVRALTAIAGRMVYDLKQRGYQESLGSIYLNESNFTRKLEAYFYLAAAEKNVVGINPFFLKAVQKALALSRLADQYCKGTTANQEDEWGDAVRHFLASASLASQLGVEKTKQYMDAHERGGTWEKSHKYFSATLMDLKNNQVGTEFGEQFRTLRSQLTMRSLNENQAVLGAAQALRSGKLTALKGAPYTEQCAGLFAKEQEILAALRKGSQK